MYAVPVEREGGGERELLRRGGSEFLDSRDFGGGDLIGFGEKDGSGGEKASRDLDAGVLHAPPLCQRCPLLLPSRRRSPGF